MARHVERLWKEFEEDVLAGGDGACGVLDGTLDYKADNWLATLSPEELLGVSNYRCLDRYNQVSDLYVFRRGSDTTIVFIPQGSMIASVFHLPVDWGGIDLGAGEG
jgi:hypothetical protein